MKITAYNLRSIGGPQTIDVNDKIVLGGLNGTGKSTIARTPYFVLTGKGLSLKHGTNEGYGIIEFANIVIQRQKKNGNTTIRVNGKTCSETAMYEHLNKHGYNPDVLCTLFDAETVLDGETMLKVAAMKLDVDKVLSFTSLKDDSLSIVKKQFEDMEIESVTIPAINKVYKKVYTSRTENNRRVKSLKALVEADLPYANHTSVNVSDLVAKSTLVQSEIEEILKQISQIEQMQQTIKQLQERIGKNKKEKALLLSKSCNFTEKDVTELSTQIDTLSKEEDDINEKFNSLNNELLKKMELLATIKAKKETIVERGKSKKNNLDVLSNTKTCPLYAGLSCTTNMTQVCEELQKEIVVLRDDCRNADAEMKAINEHIANIKNEISAIKQKGTELREKINSLIEERSAIERERMAFASIEGKVTSIDENINSDEKTLSSIEIKDVLPLQTSLQLKRDELAKIKQDIINASQLSDAVNRLAKNKKEYEVAEKLTATYTFILKELQVLPNKIFEKIISPIETGINEILAEIKSDWTIKFLFDGANLDICIKMPTGTINIDELSTGERVVINYVFKSLICKLIGFDTIVLDNTDALDVKNYAMVESVVEKSKYNTLLVNCGDIKTNFISICL